jgi:hypothetical protein
MWTPDAAVIARLEVQLGSALQAALDRAPENRYTKPSVSAYFRQYLGFVVAGHRIVYINGASEAVVKLARNADEWKAVAWDVCDGGLSFFGAEYDPRTNTVNNVTFNGGR